MKDWRDENEIASQMADAARHVGYVLTRRLHAVVIAGSPGIGKNHIVRAAMTETGNTAIRTTPVDWREVINTYDATGKRQAILWDECDHLFDSDRITNILKLALDRTGERSINFETTEEQIGPNGGKKRVRVSRTVNLAKPTIILSNRNPNDPKRWPLQVNVDAIKSRVDPFWIDGTRAQLAEYAIGLATHEEMLRWQTCINSKGEFSRRPVPRRIQEQALEYFSGHQHQLREVTPRALLNIRDAVWLTEGDADLYRRDLRHLLVHKSEPVAQPKPRTGHARPLPSPPAAPLQPSPAPPVSSPEVETGPQGVNQDVQARIVEIIRGREGMAHKETLREVAGGDLRAVLRRLKTDNVIESRGRGFWSLKENAA